MVSQPLVSYVRAQGVWDPDGLANEVLLRALTQLHRFDGNESGFRSWVFSIARCRVIDERRGVGRRPRCVTLEPGVTSIVGGCAEQESLDALGTEWVDEVLAQLEPDQRDVLLLRVVAQLTIDEIARSLEVVRSGEGVATTRAGGSSASARSDRRKFSRVAVPL